MLIWKLGFIGRTASESVLPTKAAVDKLKKILMDNGRPDDIIWGPDVEIVSTQPSITINIKCKLNEISNDKLIDLLDKLSNEKYNNVNITISIDT